MFFKVLIVLMLKVRKLLKWRGQCCLVGSQVGTVYGLLKQYGSETVGF